VSTRSKFDWITNPQVPRPTTEWDLELARSRYFSVVPSLGSLVSGWLLVVPRRRLLNLRGLSPDEKQDLESLSSRLHGQLDLFGGTVFEFEHGSIYRGSVMGCGVDQAHLHIVPLPFDLIKAAEQASEGKIIWLGGGASDDPWTATPDAAEYILIRRVAREFAVGVMTAPESQWLRKIIARNLSRAAEWDYRKNPGLPRIRATVEIFGLGHIAQSDTSCS
jgi:ATP adenylyltransferase